MKDQRPAFVPSAPGLSVVIFVRNAADTIERALNSVLGEDNSGIELLVLDGGSTDGTVEVIRRYEERIAFWRSFPDGGPEFAMKEGTERAKGDVICLLPADDWFEPGALTRVMEEFSTDPELEVLSCGARIVHYDDRGDLVLDAEFLDPLELEFRIRNLVRWLLTGGRFIRRRIYRMVGGYDLDFGMSNDLEFLIRVCLVRPKAKVAPQLAYTYRRHPSSRTLGGSMVMALMEGNIRVTARHAHDPRLLPEERRELLGLHGRSSARLAWMCLRQGQVGDAARVTWRALRMDPAWMFLIIIWLWHKGDNSLAMRQKAAQEGRE